ncbi:MAG: 3-keto-disaccharide hydrolase [Verrucomicrobiota bacterium]
MLGVVFFTACSPLLASETAIAPSGRVELFDGTSLTGWKAVSQDTNAGSIWSVTNGVIHTLGKPPGYLRTLQTYRDFELHLEWRFPDGPGNSGAFVHLNGPDQVWPLCYEAQLQTGDAGQLRLNGGATIEGLTDPKASHLPRLQPSSEKPVGEWNVCEILCFSNSIAIRINGVLQNKIAGTTQESGAIALQAEGKPVEFRHLRLMPIPKR